VHVGGSSSTPSSAGLLPIAHTPQMGHFAGLVSTFTRRRVTVMAPRGVIAAALLCCSLARSGVAQTPAFELGSLNFLAVEGEEGVTITLQRSSATSEFNVSYTTQDITAEANRTCAPHSRARLLSLAWSGSHLLSVWPRQEFHTLSYTLQHCSQWCFSDARTCCRRCAAAALTFFAAKQQIVLSLIFSHNIRSSAPHTHATHTPARCAQQLPQPTLDTPTLNCSSSRHLWRGHRHSAAAVKPRPRLTSGVDRI
jgi:hypothetical protein